MAESQVKQVKELYVGEKADRVQRGVCGSLCNMRADDIVKAVAIARNHNPEVIKALEKLATVPA